MPPPPNIHTHLWGIPLRAPLLLACIQAMHARVQHKHASMDNMRSTIPRYFAGKRGAKLNTGPRWLHQHGACQGHASKHLTIRIVQCQGMLAWVALIGFWAVTCCPGYADNELFSYDGCTAQTTKVAWPNRHPLLKMHGQRFFTHDNAEADLLVLV